MAFFALTPKRLIKNPVLFVTYIGTLVTSIYLAKEIAYGKVSLFDLQITIWLWLTLLFANFAEAVAESRGKAHASSLKKTTIQSNQLKKGDVITCTAGDIIPVDGEVIEGIASVDESAITGESAPVIRESGGDLSAVTAGTRVLSDQLTIRVTSEAGHSFLDRMIHLIEGAKRQRTPNEIALHTLLSGLSIIFLMTVASLKIFSDYSGNPSSTITLPILVSLLVCLLPTTISALLSAIGIAGMDRLMRRNVIAKSGRSVEAAGDVDLLILDKTGTITIGNRMATSFIPCSDIQEIELAKMAQLASLSDETPEGRSIVILAKNKYDLRGESLSSSNATIIPFTARTRMSGVDLLDKSGNKIKQIRKGASDAIKTHIEGLGGFYSDDIEKKVQAIAKNGGTPLLVSEDQKIMGVIELSDTLKGGIKEKFIALRKMGIRTVMITGDNPLTAAAIAAEAGVDDYLAEATPEMKLAFIKKEQEGGRLVAMTGDGTNDAPALAEADVAVAMNTGADASREAGNMIDLDSNPTKLLEIVRIGKQLLMTRGALTTFSIASDVSKYFAIIPAIFADSHLTVLNIMHLHSPKSAILSALIFNALIIIALIPLALRGVYYKPASANTLLKRNILLYGVGGILIPFIGIKLIDEILTFFGAI